MSWFSNQLRTVGQTMDAVAGIPARFVRGETSLEIVCVPVRMRPEFLAEGVAIRMELQDFYLFRDQLNGFFPQADDRIVTATETFQIVGGKKSADGIPSVEVLGSDGNRLLIHTVRIAK